MDELKPCPFCGGEVSLGPTDSPSLWKVLCPSDSPCMDTGLLVAIGRRNDSLDAAVEAWNRRAEVERLRALLQEGVNTPTNAPIFQIWRIRVETALRGEEGT